MASENHDASPHWSLVEYLEAYRTALQRLRGLGIQTHNTRLSRYERTLVKAIAAEARDCFSHQGEGPFINALVEAFDIIGIANLDDATLQPHDVMKKLRTIRGSDEAMSPDKHDPARDTALEFVIASELARRSKLQSFSTTNGDVVAAPGGWHIECKRISSLQSLEKQLHKARSQLRTQTAKGMPPGFICLDLTNPTRRLFGMIAAASDVEFSREADRRLTAMVDRVNGTIDLRTLADDPAVLGIVFRCVSHGIAGDPENVRVAPLMQLFSLHSDESRYSLEFLEATKGLGPEQLRSITLEEIHASRDIWAVEDGGQNLPGTDTAQN